MKIVFFFLSLIFGFNSYSQKKCTLHVTIQSEKAIDTLYLVKGISPYSEENLIDSFVVTNNKASVVFLLDEIGHYIIRSSISKGVNLLSFIAVPKQNASIVWSISSPQNSVAHFSNSKINVIFHKEVIEPSAFAIKKMNAYIIDSINKNTAKIDSAQKAYYKSQNRFWADSLKKIHLRHIEKYPQKFTSLFFLDKYYRDYNESYVKNYLAQLPSGLKQHTLARELAFNKFIVEKIKSFSEFELKDTLNAKFDYKPYLGHIVLVDFWASWCKPCLANIPKIDSLKLKFQDYGFRVLGVSIDENKESWKSTLRTKKMNWENVIDEKALKGITARYFRINSIPRYVLVGLNGEILNKNLSLKDAEEQLKKLLKID